MGSNSVVYGLYKDCRSVEEAGRTLTRYGFRNTDISVLFPQKPGSRAPEPDTTAPASGIFEWLAGIGSLAIRGVRPFIGSGPVMAMLDGAGVGRTTGTMLRALIAMGLPESEAKRYVERIRGGAILIAVRCEGPDWATRAKDLLRHTGAGDIASAAEAGPATQGTGKGLLQIVEQGA